MRAMQRLALAMRSVGTGRVESSALEYMAMLSTGLRDMLTARIERFSASRDLMNALRDEVKVATP